MSAFVDSMDRFTRGEKGAVEYTATGLGDATVALFEKLVRDVRPESVAEHFKMSLDEARHSTPSARMKHVVDLFVLAFQTRATRGMGKGEKKLSYLLIKELETVAGADAVCKVVHLLPHFGYWKDLLLLIEHEPSNMVKNRCIALISEQLRVDEAELAAAREEKRPPKLSLVAKYAPREGAHFDKGPFKLAKSVATSMFGSANATASMRKYRKLVSSLNTELNTTEIFMSAERYEEINFARVASLCLQRNRKAFLNEEVKGKMCLSYDMTGNRHPHDPARVQARVNLRKAMVDKQGVKGKELQPHEIVKKCMRDDLSTVEGDLMNAQWNSMRDGVVKALGEVDKERDVSGTSKSVDLGKLVALVDVSGSMTGTPMEVAIALGILVSELATTAFRDRVLTFESNPYWVDISGCSTILQKVKTIHNAPWGMSTNFEAACERILQTVERAKLSPDNIPDLIVFSDMQFDKAQNDYGITACKWSTHFGRIQRRFAEVGVKVCGKPYAAPRIIFWNLRGDTVGFPVSADSPNTQMLSGFSPALLKLVMSGADLEATEKEIKNADGTTSVVLTGPTPAETVRMALDDEAFYPVRQALSGMKSGPLAGYVWEPKTVDVE